MSFESAGSYTSSRFTTSSRKPGAVIHGTVQVRLSRLRRCEECRGWCTDEVVPGQHAPHWAQVVGGLVLVNCMGVRL